MRIVHRDIKPANIMINWSLQNLQDYTRLEDFSKALYLNPSCLKVKICDFGFAKLLSPMNPGN